MKDPELVNDLVRMIRSSLEGTTLRGTDGFCRKKGAPDILRYMGGAISETERIEAERHILSCPACLRTVGRAFRAKGRGIEGEEEGLGERMLDRTRKLLDRIESEANSLPMELKARYRSRAECTGGEPAPGKGGRRKSLKTLLAQSPETPDAKEKK